MTRERICVIGLGMVGIHFVEQLLQSDRYHIIIFGEENHYAYNRVGLTNYFEHQSLEKLYLQPPEWYQFQSKDSFEYHLSTQIVEINEKEKYVKSALGDCYSYDKLVISTGSDAVIPPVIGNEAKGIFSYRTIADLEEMIGYSGNEISEGIEKRALVIGGGLLGLEAAHAVQSLEQFEHVDIVQRSSWLLSRQLDQQAGLMVNEQVLKLGIHLRLDSSIKEILQTDGKVAGVVFQDGSMVECQMICFAIGIRARDELAATCGIKTHKRGGIIVNPFLETNVPDIYAVGECACFEDSTFGLIAPGIEMANVLLKNLTLVEKSQVVRFQTPDLSTKLKLLGVDVASFGDYFADRDGPKSIPNSKKTQFTPNDVQALVYKDPFTSTYKKYIFSADGKYLLGGMMIGDTLEYIKLLSMVKSGKSLEIPASQLILGVQGSGETGLESLEDDAQICSCMNVVKKDIVSVIKNGSCKTVEEVKKCTKAGSQCGGCVSLVQTLFESTMKEMGAQVSKALCVHFEYSRVELLHIINVRKLKTMEDVMKAVGSNADAIGCEICKPVVASIMSSLWNEHVMDKHLVGLQDTNDKYLGNIQRNGTYSVVPRIAAGEITPDKLIVLGQVAEKYKLYTKITGGQRIDLFGAKKQDLPDIWQELVNAGFESGHAYGKSLRTVKSCVGTTWCRFGQGDSVGMAIGLEERYKSIRSPHKIKGGVSGCIRECAEAQSKDFGLIATEKGYNIYVCGNGGSKPKHALLLIADCPPEKVVPIVDRFMMFYIQTADKLQRTARWIENLPGGLDYLKDVILNDSLRICSVLEAQMQDLVGTNFDEWRQVVESRDKRMMFQQFANTSKRIDTIEIVKERGQYRPANWPKHNLKTHFANHSWSELTWVKIVHSSKLKYGSCCILYGDTQLAIYKVKDSYYCTQQMCPHKRAFVLHDGIIGDDGKDNFHVACPLHKRKFNLKTGSCSDPEMSIATFEVSIDSDGMILLKLPPQEELDKELGTDKWRVKEGEERDQLQVLDIIGRPLKSTKVSLEW